MSIFASSPALRAVFLVSALQAAVPADAWAERGEALAFSGGANASLGNINPKLRQVVNDARRLSSVEFRIKEGCRSGARQEMLRKKGFSNTSESKHEDGNAVDLVPLKNGMPDDGNVKAFRQVRDAMMKAARQNNVSITWGGSWAGFRDLYHFQLGAAHRRKFCR